MELYIMVSFFICFFAGIASKQAMKQAERIGKGIAISDFSCIGKGEEFFFVRFYFGVPALLSS